MLIDAHLHQWDPTAVDYPWLASAPPVLAEPHPLSQIEHAALSSGVTEAVLVQAADSEADTAAMLAAAREHPWIAGVVAWAPLDDPPTLRRLLGQFARQPLVVGVRSLIHDREDAEWILSDAVALGLAALAREGLPFDFVTSSPSALAHVPVLAARHPGLTIVIDHLGKPPLGGTATELDAWRELLHASARFPRVVAKVSGLYPTCGSAWTRADVRGVLATALDCLGPRRLMLGSDWPMSLTAGGYERVWHALLAEVDLLPPATRDWLRWRTASTTYLTGRGAAARKETP